MLGIIWLKKRKKRDKMYKQRNDKKGPIKFEVGMKLTGIPCPHAITTIHNSRQQ